MRPRARKPKEPTVAGARETALRALSRREHSAAELEYKLERRGHDESTISDIVGTLAASGWQSDERYAEMLVRSRAAQGYGPLRIEHELSQAGVTDALIRGALAQADVDWAGRCEQVHARRFRRGPSGAADWQKQYRYLASHGFTAEHIRGVLKRAPEDAEDAF
jgi:regulatory protein